MGVLEELRDVLPDGALVTDPDIMDPYRRDRAETVVPGMPLAVVRATSVADVQAVLRVASAAHVPVVARGAGTGLSGGSSAVDGAITLSTEKLRDLDVDPAAMLAVVGPGLLNAEVKEAARQHDLWYPPDPSSFEICSIGGNLATNAGGLCCVKYGVTTDYVLALDVVLADGTLVHLGGRTIKDVAGYDLKRLFVGSEGTLGIIVGATLRLRPLPPPATTLVATFADVVAAGLAVVDVVGRVRPAALELMDRASVAAVEAARPMGLNTDVGALLLARSDAGSRARAAPQSGGSRARAAPQSGGSRAPQSGGSSARADEVGWITDACERAGATYVAATDDEDEGEMLMAARRMAIPAVERLGTVLIEDVGVPIPEIPRLVAAVEAIAERRATAIPVIGHAGDGNLHPLVTFDRHDPDAAARAELAFDDVMEAALDLGGTVTGEHGIGMLKARHLAEQLGPDVLRITRAVKAALDPYGILNPGKWV